MTEEPLENPTTHTLEELLSERFPPSLVEAFLSLGHVSFDDVVKEYREKNDIPQYALLADMQDCYRTARILEQQGKWHDADLLDGISKKLLIPPPSTKPKNRREQPKRKGSKRLPPQRCRPTSANS